jgi:hypothetical protein
MPQITLKLSNNINITTIDFKSLFTAIHGELGNIPQMDNRTCFSGLVHEDYSYVGRGDESIPKIFLEILWLETPERSLLKPALASKLMEILVAHLKEPLKRQSLTCQPRVSIANLGEVNQDYYIYKP